jgi:iron complex transport system ATP-binding protein
MNQTDFSIKNLKIGYSDNTRFPEISMNVNSSELIVLLGKNGAGKSTLLRTLAGLQTPLSGTVELMGRNITRYSQKEKAAMIGFVSTEKIGISDMTVFELVSLGRYSYTNWFGALSDDDKSTVRDALKMTGILHLEHKNINEISDGELQRVMIARTIAQNTPVIILDEPAAFLDLPNRFEILLLLRKLAWNENKTVILSMHDLDMALRFADNIWIITDRDFLYGAPEDFTLNRRLDCIFENTAITFNYQSGAIDAGFVPTKEISLKCSCPDTKFWLEKALNRTGHAIVEHSDITVKAQDGSSFVLRQNGKDSETFFDIYSLCRRLR